MAEVVEAMPVPHQMVKKLVNGGAMWNHSRGCLEGPLLKEIANPVGLGKVRFLFGSTCICRRGDNINLISGFISSPEDGRYTIQSGQGFSVSSIAIAWQWNLLISHYYVLLASSPSRGRFTSRSEDKWYVDCCSSASRHMVSFGTIASSAIQTGGRDPDRLTSRFLGRRAKLLSVSNPDGQRALEVDED
nr:hypothetical protein Iba_chr12bCG15180 [Ipomoea batatas]